MASGSPPSPAGVQERPCQGPCLRSLLSGPHRPRQVSTGLPSLCGALSLVSQGPIGSAPHLVCLPVPEEVDRAVQAPLDDGPAPRVVPLLAPHLHEAVGVLRLHQVDGAGVMPVFQGLQAVSPWAWGHRRAHVTHRPAACFQAAESHAPPPPLHPKQAQPPTGLWPPQGEVQLPRPIRGSLPADSAPTVHHEMETLINKQFVSFKRCSVLSSAVTPHAVPPRPAQDVRHCSVQCLRAAHAARPSVTQRPSQSSGRLPWHHRACVQGTLTLLSNGPKHKGREAGDSDVPRRSRKALPLGQKGKVLYLRKEKLVC